MKATIHRIVGALACAALIAGCGGNTPQSASLNTKTADVLSLLTTPVVAPVPPPPNSAAALAALPIAQSAIESSLADPTLDTSPDTTANHFDATTVSADGTTVAFTVYSPNIARGNAAPLLLEGHGFGGKRTRTIDSMAFADQANTPLQTAKLALSSGIQGGKSPTRGWYVISFDQRGFGETGGLANTMDPRLEGKDVSAILDWAQRNLPRLAYRRDPSGVKQPVIGAVGLSYGGGYQTIGSGVDHRITAIVPTTTWHDLRYSLYSDVPKSFYLSLLVGVGTAGMGRLEPFIYTAFTEANTLGYVDSGFSQRMYLHSPISYCENNSPDMQQPRIPAFFIQASTDILFNLTEGFQNFECFHKKNPRSKFLGVRFGHPDPLVMIGDGKKFTEENIDCGGTGASNSISVARQAYSFLTQNLIDSSYTASYSNEFLTLPDIRAVLEDGRSTNGPLGESTEHQCYEVASLALPNESDPDETQSTFVTPTIQRGGDAYPRDANGAATTASLSNVVLGVPTPVQGVIGQTDPTKIITPAMSAFATPDAGTVIPLVQPLGVDRTLFGVPSVHLVVNAPVSATTSTSPANPPILYLGLVRKTPDGKQQLVHDQVMPVKGYGDKTVALAGLSMRLHGDETLGLVVFGFHPQYYNTANRIPVTVNLSGISAALPFK